MHSLVKSPNLQINSILCSHQQVETTCALPRVDVSSKLMRKQDGNNSRRLQRASLKELQALLIETSDVLYVTTVSCIMNVSLLRSWGVK